MQNLSHLSLKKKNTLLSMMLFVSFIYSFNFALPLYVSSTFLNKFIPSSYIGLIYSCAALITILFNFSLSKLIRKYHSYNTSMAIIFLSLLSSILLAVTKNPYFVIPLFIIYYVCTSLLFTILNIFISEFETNKKGEGKVRGLFLMFLSTGILFSALMSGLIISILGYSALWIITSLFIFPIMYIFYHFYKNIEDPNYKHITLIKSYNILRRNKDLSLVYFSILLLESFFTLMIIFTPLYLSLRSSISITVYASAMMPIILIPFIILPYALGKLADEFKSEKELLIIGLMIIFLSTVLFPLVVSTSYIYILILLFISRVGATMVETMGYSYFFKNVKSDDINMISFFGSVRSIGLLITTFCASLILMITDNFDFVFYLFALILAILIYKIKDIRNIS